MAARTGGNTSPAQPAPILSPLQLDQNGVITSPAWIAYFQQVILPALGIALNLDFSPERLLLYRKPEADGETLGANETLAFRRQKQESAEFPASYSRGSLGGSDFPAATPRPRYANEFPPVAPRVSPTWLVSDVAANMAKYPPSAFPLGAIFEVTDWKVLYRNTGAAWVYVSGIYIAVLASRPAGLGANDAGFLFLESDNFYAADLWNGAAWVQLPTAPFTQTDVTGSRAFGTTYQNAGRFPLNVKVIGHLAAGGTMVAVSDSGAVPVLEVDAGVTQASDTSISFQVLPGNYYKVTATALTVLTKWIE